MTLNKYNEYMSHIEVTDEMKARVLANVSKAIEEQGKDGEKKASVTPMPVKKRIPVITLISIAATVIIVGGIAVLFISNYFGSNKPSKSAHSKMADTTQVDSYAADSADEADLSPGLDGGAAAAAGEDKDAGECDSDDGEAWIEETTSECGEEETLTDGVVTKQPDVSGDGENAYLIVPITNLETSVSEENGTRIISLNGDENSATVYIANDGTDLTSLYLITDGTTVTDGVTDGGINYALYNTIDPDSNTYNAATFAYAGNNYLIVLEKPVPEDNIREFIAEY